MRCNQRETGKYSEEPGSLIKSVEHVSTGAITNIQISGENLSGYKYIVFLRRLQI